MGNIENGPNGDPDDFTEEIDKLNQLLESLLGESRTKALENFTYNLTKQTASFIRENNFKDVVLLDRSARPFAMALMTYWNLAFKGEKKPGIFFLNPKPLKGQKSEEDLKEQFGEEHKYLYKDKDDPIFVFDICSHKGKTLEAAASGLKKAGFSNLSFGLAFDDRGPEDKNRLPVNFAYRETSGEAMCYPFGPEEFLTKGEKLHAEIADGAAKDERLLSLAKHYVKIFTEAENRYWYSCKKRDEYIDEAMADCGMTREEEKSIERKLNAHAQGMGTSTATDRMAAMGVRKTITQTIKNRFEQESRGY